MLLVYIILGCLFLLSVFNLLFSFLIGRVVLDMDKRIQVLTAILAMIAPPEELIAKEAQKSTFKGKSN